MKRTCVLKCLTISHICVCDPILDINAVTEVSLLLNLMKIRGLVYFLFLIWPYTNISVSVTPKFYIKKIQM
jgi:hypothetical protein